MKPEVLEAIAEDLTAVMDGMMDVDVTTNHLGKGCAGKLPDILREHIPPLEWEIGAPVAKKVPYQIWSNNGGSGSPDDPLVQYDDFMLFDPHMNTLGEFKRYEDAENAANAHHKDSLMKAMGLK